MPCFDHDIHLCANLLSEFRSNWETNLGTCASAHYKYGFSLKHLSHAAGLKANPKHALTLHLRNLSQYLDLSRQIR